MQPEIDLQAVIGLVVEALAGDSGPQGPGRAAVGNREKLNGHQISAEARAGVRARLMRELEQVKARIAEDEKIRGEYSVARSSAQTAALQSS
jgi:hypothetical protein